MDAPKKPIRLRKDEDSLLRKLYVQFRIPRDQFKRRPKDLASFIKQWNDLSGRDDEAGEVIRYIKNQQKAKRRLAVPWPTFDGAHKRAPSVTNTLDEIQLAVLREIYETIVIPWGIGIDLVESNDALLNKISQEFAKKTGLIVPGLTLVAIAEDQRKHGDWYTVGRRGLGFNDMDKLDKAEDDE